MKNSPPNARHPVERRAAKMEELIGDRLKRIRKHLRMTQMELAQAMGVSSGYISDIEKNKKSPGRDVLKKLYDKFHVDINYLFSGEGEFFLERGKGKEETRKKEPKTWSEIKDIDDTEKVIEEMIWYIKHVPIVRYAMIEFFLGYIYERRDLIEEEVAKYREKK